MGLRWAAPDSAAGLVARVLGPSGEQKLALKAVECLSVRDTESGGPKMCEFYKVAGIEESGGP